MTNIAFIKAKSGLGDELGRRLTDLVEPSREEAGCINYDLHRSETDPDLWCVYENCCTAEDLAQHFDLPHMQTFAAEVPRLVEGDLDLRRFRMVSSPAW
ncbi:putative quinol monooxygenase [Mycolicibacterium arseniciresistens]|uniref:Quinol monooxygenase n=1 Tax=Mycolicibacterium arseniciresistens TaxID=3062257 RepID=A0ABT8UED7_9MYCO|nr:putative quinol monooxygenase [Mycolicibacterium arseniciresistens]MDO3635145.1 putative quinol monooxygenase [Mycolicibacterium arseniciresistens]